MDNNKTPQNNMLNNPTNQENPFKYVDEFKKICHDMFKNFLDQNLCTIVDDVYKKFSDKINPDATMNIKNDIKDDIEEMVNNTINEKIDSKSHELETFPTQQPSSQNKEEQSKKKTNGNLLLEKIFLIKIL